MEKFLEFCAVTTFVATCAVTFTAVAMGVASCFAAVAYLIYAFAKTLL